MVKKTSTIENKELLQKINELEKIRQEFEQLRQKYQEETKQFSLIVNHMQDAVALVDDKDFLLYLSPSHEQIFRFKPAQRVGCSFYTFIHPHDLAVVQNIIQEHVTKREQCTLEFRYLQGNGNYCWVESVANTIVDEQDRLECIIISARPIEERKLAEITLRKSEKLYRNVIENIRDVFFRIDREGVINMISPSGARLLGFASTDELTGQNLFGNFFADPDERENFLTAINEFGYLDDYEIILKSSNGSIIYASTSSYYDYDVNAGSQMIEGTIRDITNRKKAEAENASLQAQLNNASRKEALGSLAAGIANDFNNVLSGIQGHCSLIQFNLPPADPNFKHLQGIETQVRSGAHLTRQLLDMTGFGQGVMKPADLNAVLLESSSVFARAKKGIIITRKLEENIWPVEADTGQINQVLLNIFINAAQSMHDEGNIYLESKKMVIRDDDAKKLNIPSGKYVRLSITDTGPGMNEETAKNAFQPVFTTQKQESGMGLELTSSYNIIKNHRGIITIDCEPQKGSTFHIYLPATQQKVAAATTPQGELSRGKETILIVDDEAIIADTTKEILEVLGYNILLAGSGQEAVAVFMEKKSIIDLVILDMVMPGMGGTKVFEALRAVNPSIRIILYSGYRINEEIQALLDRGSCGFIQKPFGVENLSNKIREVIGNQQ